MSHNYDVRLNGCGPVGGIASLLLGTRGFKVAVIDLNKSPYPHPRAVGLNGYSMSIIETVLKDSWKEFQFTSAVEVGYVMGVTQMDKPFGKMEPPIIEGKVLDLDKYGFLNWFNQPQLEKLLRIQIKKNKNITTYFGTESLVLWEEKSRNCLQIQKTASGKTETITSKYLIGADGGGSFVRKQMGANLKTLGKAISFLVADIEAPASSLKEGMHFDAGGWQIIDPSGKRPTTFINMSGKKHGTYKNNFRFEFALKDGENFTQMQSPDSIEKLVEPFLKKNSFKILRSTVYKFNSMISEMWRANNTFTIGDATHQTSPFLGQGLNLGIRNTFNLIKKIDLVNKGVSEASILDKYQVECFPDSQFIIKQSLFMGNMLFNVKPHINFLRSIIYFFKGARGSPIDLFPAFVPETITVPNGFKPGKTNQKGYPMYNFMTKEGFPRSLREYKPFEYRVLCNNSSVEINKVLKNIEKAIKPLCIVLSEGLNGEKTSDDILVCAPRKEDKKMHRKLFDKADYVLMAPGYTMLGTYNNGEEDKLFADYKSLFDLVAN